jgi:hypothetical protein
VSRLAVLSAALAALAALTACGSSHQAGPSVLRVFDPTGHVRTQVTLAGIDRRQIGVADDAQQHRALLWLPFTKSGEGNFCRLTDALERRGAPTHDHNQKYAVEINGHVYQSSAMYSIDYTYNHPDYCSGGPDGVDVVMVHQTARQATQRLRALGILDVQELKPSASSTVAGGSRTYKASEVKAVFARHGFRLRYPGLWEEGGLPRTAHALPLSYVVSGGAEFKPNGAVKLTAGGPYFEIVIFRSPAAARSILTPRVLLYLRYLHQPWARAANVDLVATSAVRHTHAWEQALHALKTLGRR